MTETSALRELDAEIATKIFGWALTAPIDNACDYAVGVNRDGSSAKRNFCSDGAREFTIPNYAGDVRETQRVEDEIARRGLGAKYADELTWAILGRFTEIDSNDTFKLLRASPEQRCRAALQAIAHDSQPANGVAAND